MRSRVFGEFSTVPAFLIFMISLAAAAGYDYQQTSGMVFTVPVFQTIPESRLASAKPMNGDHHQQQQLHSLGTSLSRSRAGSSANLSAAGESGESVSLPGGVPLTSDTYGVTNVPRNNLNAVSVHRRRGSLDAIVSWALPIVFILFFHFFPTRSMDCRWVDYFPWITLKQLINSVSFLRSLARRSLTELRWAAFYTVFNVESCISASLAKRCSSTYLYSKIAVHCNRCLKLPRVLWHSICTFICRCAWSINVGPWFDFFEYRRICFCHQVSCHRNISFHKLVKLITDCLSWYRKGSTLFKSQNLNT